MITETVISVPAPLRRVFRGTVLALGAEQKANFCVGDGVRLHWYHGFGDLKDANALRVYTAALEAALAGQKRAPRFIGHDFHPQFITTRMAAQLQKTRFPRAVVLPQQHHRAHAAGAAVLTDVSGRRLTAMICDGTGWGTDGTVWGCECFSGRLDCFERRGRLAYMALPGADQAVRQPWRLAVALLYEAFGDDVFSLKVPWLRAKKRQVELILRMLHQGVNSPRASSAGRLFDGVAALCGVCLTQEEPAQAPRKLEQLARGWGGPAGRMYPVVIRSQAGMEVFQIAPLVRGMVRDIQARVPRAEIAARFHATFSRGISRLCLAAARACGTRDVLLAGGVFFNKIIEEQTRARLAAGHMSVHVPEAAGRGDDVISLGQAVMAYVFGNSGARGKSTR